MDQVWVFGYGSLMWDYQEYNPSRVESAKLIGAHRSYNRKSTKSRGRPEAPGLVLGLEPGGECTGKVIQIQKRYVPIIDRREGVTFGAYNKIITPSEGLEVIIDNKKLDQCIVYVANPASRNYIGENLSLKEKAEMAIRAAPGDRGNSIDYIKETYLLSQRLGIHDPSLRDMYKEVLFLQRNSLVKKI